MLKHLFKLVWNRKRTNFLIILEIFFSFLVLFAVATLGVFYADNYSHSLGFSYENVWNIAIDLKQTSDDYWTPEQAAITQQLFIALQDFDEVEATAAALTPPFVFGGRNSVNLYEGRQIEMDVNEVTDDFKNVLDLQLVSGRWFSREDDAMNWKPVVINQRLSHELFGAEDPIGKSFKPWASDGDCRVIGVVTDFRKNGEYSQLGNYLFERRNLNDPQQRPPRNLLLKVRPGTTALFEEKLITKLQSIARDWSFEIQPLAAMRESHLKFYLAILIGFSIVAISLMIMVGLGLMGVLWQNVTQRTREIGLRRAKGATAGKIHTQILGELLMLTSFGLALGTLIVIQFPLLDLIGFISTKVFLLGLTASLLIIYAIATLCGLYPSYLATKVQPAEALHYE